MNTNLLDWYNVYSQSNDKRLCRKIESACQKLWDLYADSAMQVAYNQEDDEDDFPLFEIRISCHGFAMRYYYDSGEWKGLFQGDLYDLLIIGWCDEMLMGGGYDLI